jgi:hypothetical protein
MFNFIAIHKKLNPQHIEYHLIKSPHKHPYQLMSQADIDNLTMHLKALVSQTGAIEGSKLRKECVENLGKRMGFVDNETVELLYRYDGNYQSPLNLGNNAPVVVGITTHRVFKIERTNVWSTMITTIGSVRHIKNNVFSWDKIECKKTDGTVETFGIANKLVCGNFTQYLSKMLELRKRDEEKKQLIEQIRAEQQSHDILHERLQKEKQRLADQLMVEQQMMSLEREHLINEKNQADCMLKKEQIAVDLVRERIEAEKQQHEEQINSERQIMETEKAMLRFETDNLNCQKQKLEQIIRTAEKDLKKVK